MMEDELYPTDDIPYPGILKTVPWQEAAMKITLYFIVTIVSLLGNCCIILTVCRSKRMHTTTNYYLANLAVSDLVVTVSCGWVHLVDDLSEGWILGEFFCKMNSFMQGL